jgi:hypothetical protein
MFLPLLYFGILARAFFFRLYPYMHACMRGLFTSYGNGVPTFRMICGIFYFIVVL